MSFWSWFSRASRPPAPTAIEPEPRPVISDVDRDFVRTALDRFRANGLMIKRELDRDLIVARALVDSFRWKDDGIASAPSLQLLFLALADETDSLTNDVDLVTELYPPLATIDDDDAEQMLAMHSNSVFVNASSITLLNEDVSLRSTIHNLAELGDVRIEQIELHKLKAGMLKATFMIEDLGPGGFEIEDRKRPDPAPLLAEMNRIALAIGRGRYLVVHEGGSESDTFILADDATVPLLSALVGADPAAKP
jgi:hypothetical protein